MSIELHNQTKNLIHSMYSQIEFFNLNGDIYKFIPNNDELTIHININTIGNAIYNATQFNNNNNSDYEAFRFSGTINYIVQAECPENTDSDKIYRETTTIFDMTDYCKAFKFYISEESNQT